MGDVFRQWGFLEEALNYFDKILQRLPTNDFILSRRGLVYIQQGKYEAALKDFEEALKIHPKNEIAPVGKMMALQFLQKS